jgi:hypothetical protein
MYRTVRERVRTLAPFLRLENDPYVVVVSGRLLWVLDAYTLADQFPYAEKGPGAEWNYVRNSVKVVVDAYHGTVRLYACDDQDPVLGTWARRFPGMFSPVAELNRDFPGLRAHLRYPETLFTIQAIMLQRYHMNSVEEFYQNEDLWRIPDRPEVESERVRYPVEPYYVIIKPPGETQARFMLIVPFDRAGKDVMAAWLAAPCDAPDYSPPGRTRLRLYRFPKGQQVHGLRQVFSLINSQQEISERLSLWQQRGSRVIFGNLQAVPVEDALLYAVPIYLSSEREEQAQLPRLQKVVVVRPPGDLVMADTLEEALRQVAGEAHGAETGLATQSGTESGPAKTAVSPTPAPVDDPARRALNHYRAAVRHRQSGDWAGYGREMDLLESALEKMNMNTGSSKEKR